MKTDNTLPVIKKSLDLLVKAEDLIPCATQTLAKGPGQNVRGVSPAYLERGNGSHVWDVDGNEFIDYTMGVGPLILGYCHETTDNAIMEQLRKGITFSLMHPLELEVAQLINKVVPNAESVRFSKTGCDVTSAAIRLARAFTGKNTVLCCGYHGWHDWYISVTDRNNGIPMEITDLTYTFNYNDIDYLMDSIDEDTAAIILEPVVFEEPKDNFLHKIREICDIYNIVLIFDEMWTGFRMSLGGAQEYFGIKADLATFSKAIANGMPLSVLTGRKDIMSLLEKDVFFFTTFGGEALSLAAAKATITEMINNDIIGSIHKKGLYLKNSINSFIADLGLTFLKVNGYPFRTVLSIGDTGVSPLIVKSIIQQECIRRGILWHGFFNMSASHSNSDIEYTIESFHDILMLLRKAISENTTDSLLMGEPVQPVFRRIGNFNMKPKLKGL